MKDGLHGPRYNLSPHVGIQKLNNCDNFWLAERSLNTANPLYGLLALKTTGKIEHIGLSGSMGENAKTEQGRVAPVIIIDKQFTNIAELLRF